jgi:L-erythro-3,5-diaminohexanoate dehydrogenase
MTRVIVKACRFGSHRVLEPTGSLPQAAWRLDATPIARESEIVCDVDVLNIDSASFQQISTSCERDVERVALRIAELVRERGKHHNPVTGSGGMFVGRVREIGSSLRETTELREGDRIASLVSLALTPLEIASIEAIDMSTGRVWIKGTAVLFESGIFAKLPGDIPDDVALAVLDVAGAPAQVRRLAHEGQTVLVLGADGKSGMLACVQARHRVGRRGRVIGIAPSSDTAAARLLIERGYVADFIEADARDALALLESTRALIPQGADLTINCVNVPGTELASILSTRDGGTVYFFSMSTSFTAAALGAEGVGKDVTMIIGNGYATGHAEIALQTLRDHPHIHQFFLERYGQPAR